MPIANRSFLVCVAALSACSATAAPPPPTAAVVVAQPPPPPPPPPAAMVRVIHASPDQFAATVVAYMDNGDVPIIPALQYRTAAGYNPIPAGTHTVQARMPGTSPQSPPALSWNTPALVSNHAYTIIAHGLASDLSGPQVTFVHQEDALTTPPAGRANVRFFHGLVGGGTVDVCLNGATPAFVGVAYGTFATAYGTQGPYASAAPGPTTVTFRGSAAAGAPCTGRVVGSVQVQLRDQANVTLVAVGRIARGAGAVAPEVLVCADAPPVGPSECVPAAVRAGR